MVYTDERSEAVFTGGVRMQANGSDLHGDHAVVFLSNRASGTAKPAAGLTAAAAPVSRSIERAVLSGSVRMTEPGRSGVGEQLLYTAASDSFVLTGTSAHPPRISDAQQGSVTGKTLIFGAANSTIVVSGDGTSRDGRVHTETGVEP